jgi:chemotaxis response regulator CheB
VPIRLLLVQLPHFLEQVLERQIGDDPDLRIVARATRATEALVLIDEIDPDVVVIGTEGETVPALAGRALAAHPQLKLLAISTDGRAGFLYELRPHMVPLGELSAGRVIAAIKAFVAVERA